MPSSGIFGRQLLGTFGLGAPNTGGPALAGAAFAASNLYATLVQSVSLSAVCSAMSSQQASTVGLLNLGAAGLGTASLAVVFPVGVTAAGTSAGLLTPTLSLSGETDATSAGYAAFSTSTILVAWLAAVSTGEAGMTIEGARTVSFSLGAPRQGDTVEGPI